MSKKEKCSGGFSMSPSVHLRGCGCPECAIQENVTSKDEYIQSVVNCLKILIKEERIIVFDPKSRRCLSGDNIINVCVNGDSVQITLSPNWQKD